MPNTILHLVFKCLPPYIDLHEWMSHRLREASTVMLFRPYTTVGPPEAVCCSIHYMIAESWLTAWTTVYECRSHFREHAYWCCMFLCDFPFMSFCLLCKVWTTLCAYLTIILHQTRLNLCMLLLLLPLYKVA